MAKIISVVNQKGGVGKTTTAINTAAYLAHKGKFVLLVDMDPQCNASSGIGFSVQSFNAGMYEVLVDGLPIGEIIHKTKVDGLSLAPATISLAGASVELVPFTDREFRLKSSLDSIQNAYDYILIDCPPSLGLLTVNCLIASDQVLMPVQAEYYALEGLSQLLNTVNLIREHIKPELQVLGALITMYDRRNLLSWQVKNELVKHFPFYVFKSVVPRNIRLTEAPSHGLPISVYAPYSKGAYAYERLASEILDLLMEKE